VTTSAAASVHSQVTEPPAVPAAPKPNQQTVRSFCDLAVKRHDLAERSFDAMNTRLGVVFAFNSFLLPSSITALRSSLEPSAGGSLASPWWWIAIAFWGLALATVTAATVVGYWPRDVKSLPDPLMLYVNCGAKEPVEADKQVIADLNESWKSITEATSAKSKCLNVAIAAVVAELLFLGVLSGAHIAEVNMANDRKNQEQTNRENKHIRNDTDGKLPAPQPNPEHASVIKKAEDEPPKRDQK
jgi:hypothetical protein